MEDEIKNTIASCYTHVSEAYDKLESMGATMPAEKNIENLRDTIYTLDLDVDKYKVTFDDGETQNVKEVYPGQAVTEPAKPIREGCMFLYWYEQALPPYDPENPTLEGLKSALNSGNLDNVEIGTEIPDQWNGNDNPLIVGTKQVIEKDGNRYLAVGLTRKYVEPTAQVFNDPTTSTYPTSQMFSYLNNGYLELCSDSLKNMVSEAPVSWYNGTAIQAVSGKVHLFSGVEVYGTVNAGEGKVWEYWKTKTGLSAPSDGNANNRRIAARNGTLTAFWLRSRQSATGGYGVSASNGSVYNMGNYTGANGVLPQFWILSDNTLPSATLDNLKTALVNGTATNEFPAGTQISDTYNGQNNPLVVAQYLDGTNNTSYSGAEGVILVRKYVEPIQQQFGSNWVYTISWAKSFLDTTYFNNCSDGLKADLSDINIPYYDGSSIIEVPSKWFLLSAYEVCNQGNYGAAGYEGVMFDYWRQETGLSSPDALSTNNNGRIVKDRSGTAQTIWLRSRSVANVCGVYSGGGIAGLGPGGNYGILPACFIAKPTSGPITTAEFNSKNVTVSELNSKNIEAKDFNENAKGIL